jgi:hypothetical protein
MVKQILRQCIKRFETWLEDEPTIGNKGPGDYEFIYYWLNTKFVEMARQGFSRPHIWGILQGVNLAKALGIPRVSIVEFGVAGGNGQIQMERIATTVEKIFDVHIDIYGFDTSKGLPAPTDYRDLPNLCSEGLYKMDLDKLRARLVKAKLVLGDIKDTITEFIQSRPAPIAFIACDLILYTSTVSALRLLDASENLLLPRIHCYFDDVLGFTSGDCNGERLAIHEFNRTHDMRKLSPIYGLKYYLPLQYSDAMWVEKFWLAHIFDHSSYCKRDNLVNRHNLDLNAEQI